MPSLVLDTGALTALIERAPLSAGLAMVQQIALVVAGALVAHAARRSESWFGGVGYRWLQVAGGVQFGAAALRLAEMATGFGVGPLVLAGHTLVDVGVLLAVGGGLKGATSRGDMGPSRVVLVGGVAAVGLFCALVAEPTATTLFARNLPAAAGQVMALSATGLFLIWSQVWCLYRERQELLTRCAWEEAQQGEWSAACERAEQRGRDLEAALESHRSAAVDSRRRTRTLEQILTVSARINATRELPELLAIIVGATEEILGFRRVIVYLYSDSVQAFQARAFAGVSETEQAHLANRQVNADEFRSLTDPRFRYSNCYLQNGRANEIAAADPSHSAPDDAATEDRADADPAVDGTTPDDAVSGDLPAATDGEEAASREFVPSESGRSWAIGPANVSNKWCENCVLIAPLVSGAGDTRGYLSVAQPVDGRVPSPLDIRQLEFLVRQAAAAVESVEMYQHLARKNSELAQASEKLKSLGVMKANFVANVSHELRTPLTSISAYTELLQRDTQKMSGDVQREFLRVINQESLKLTRIIDDILELSRMSDGKVRLDKVRTDLRGLIGRLEESWRLRAEPKSIDFNVAVVGETVELEADPLLLQQLLDHLVGNAFKFTPEGGRVLVGAEECGTAVRITVEDDGIGIPADQLDAIFEQFYQVDASATRQHNGQGVGLALCQDIVGYHDGRIWVENVTPNGARFTVLLPRRPAVMQPVAMQRTVRALSDSNQFMQRLMHWISESLGVQIATLMVPDESHEHLIIRAAIGVPESVVQSTSVRRGGGFAGKAWVTGRSLLVEDVRRDERFRNAVNDARYTTPSVLCVPLVHGLDVIGIVTVNNRIDGRPLGGDDRRLLEAMAPRITYLLRMHHDHERSGREFASIQASLRATTMVGHLHHEHVTAVCHEICLATARSIGLPDEEIEHLAFALQFYDVGMSAVPAHLLHQSEALSEEERHEIAKHVPASLTILAPLEPPTKVRQIINHHHENYNGSGYPEGLAGEAIPLGARLLRLTDMLNAILQRRPYREPLTVDEALDEIRAGIGSLYCPRLTNIFLNETEARRDRLEGLTGPNRDAVDLARSALRLPSQPARV